MEDRRPQTGQKEPHAVNKNGFPVPLIGAIVIVVLLGAFGSRPSPLPLMHIGDLAT